jgi:hypothetical protein
MEAVRRKASRRAEGERVRRADAGRWMLDTCDFFNHQLSAISYQQKPFFVSADGCVLTAEGYLLFTAPFSHYDSRLTTYGSSPEC